MGGTLMTWRVATSLDVLLGQLNAAAPKRSKVSDGSIGDAAHASRDSDHNPWIKVGTMGVVSARDFTHDPKGGLDCNRLAADLVASRDPRIKYVIWNRRIWTPGKGWQKYSGSNPHDKHLHLSVESTASKYDSTARWAVLGPAPAPAPRPPAPAAQPAPPEDDMFDPNQHIEAIARRSAEMVSAVMPTRLWDVTEADPDKPGQRVRMGALLVAAAHHAYRADMAIAGAVEAMVKAVSQLPGVSEAVVRAAAEAGARAGAAAAIESTPLVISGTASAAHGEPPA